MHIITKGEIKMDKDKKWKKDTEEQMDLMRNRLTFFEISEESRKQSAKLGFSIIYVLLAVLAFGMGALMAKVFFLG